MSAEQEVKLINKITQHFQSLNDDILDNYEPSYVRSVLLTPGATRNKTLRWALEKLHPASALSLEREPSTAHPQRMLNSFSALCLCKTGDLNIIKGEASPLSQLQFWAAVLESVHHLCHIKVSQAKLDMFDSFMGNLTLLPHLDSTLSASRMGLIDDDDDLRKKYQLWCEKGHHSSFVKLMENTQSELEKRTSYFENKDLHEMYKEPIEQEGFENALKTLETKLMLQRDQCTGLCDTFDSDISPWIGTPEPITETIRGPLIRQMNTQVQQFIKDLHTVEEVTRANIKLKEIVKLSEQRHQHPPKSMKDLKDLLENL
ncbi:uncharacterized protein LOC143036082 [Oratosquilla oratoria]|uniref:uncharacterized protein LOC143036082 n=1 Tax=Oratosquilla oratoria TaxID=337810 RepID=UPI003F75F996